MTEAVTREIVVPHEPFQITRLQEKAYNKIRDLVDRIIRDGKIVADYSFHRRGLRQVHSLKSIRHELSIFTGLSNFSNLSVQSGGSATITFDPTFTEELKRLDEEMKRGYTIKLPKPLEPGSQEILKQRKEHFHREINLKADITSNIWHRDTPDLVGVYGYEKEFDAAFASFRSKEKTLTSISNKIEALTSEPASFDALLTTLDPSVVSKMSALELRNKYVKSRLEQLDVEISDLDSSTDKSKEYIDSLNTEKMNDEEYKIFMSTVRKHNFSARKLMELDRERKMLKKEEVRLRLSQPLLEAFEKADRLFSARYNQTRIPAYIFPSNGLPPQFILPKTKGIVSDYISGTFDYVLPSDTELETTKKSSIYVLDGSTQVDTMTNFIETVSHETDRFFGIRLVPRIVDTLKSV